MQSRTLHSRLTNFGSVTPWHDRDLEYAIAVSGDAFLQAGTSGESTVTGAFFGVQHQAVGGTLDRDDLSAVFGGKRWRPGATDSGYYALKHSRHVL